MKREKEAFSFAPLEGFILKAMFLLIYQTLIQLHLTARHNKLEYSFGLFLTYLCWQDHCCKMKVQNPDSDPPLLLDSERKNVPLDVLVPLSFVQLYRIKVAPILISFGSVSSTFSIVRYSKYLPQLLLYLQKSVGSKYMVDCYYLFTSNKN